VRGIVSNKYNKQKKTLEGIKKDEFKVLSWILRESSSLIRQYGMKEPRLILRLIWLWRLTDWNFEGLLKSPCINSKIIEITSGRAKCRMAENRLFFWQEGKNIIIV